MRFSVFGDSLLHASIWILFFSIFSSASGIGLGTALLVLGCMFAFRKEWAIIPRLPLFWPIVSMVLAVVLSVAFAEGSGFSKSVLKLRYLGVYLLLLAAFLRFPFLGKRLQQAAVYLSLLLCLVALLQFTRVLCPLEATGILSFPPPLLPGTRGYFAHARGFLYHHNPFAFGSLHLFFLTVAPCIVSIEKGEGKTFSPFAFASFANLLCIALSGSRGAWLALLLASGVVVWVGVRRRGKIVTVAGAMLLGFGLILFLAIPDRVASFARPYENNDRLPMWRISWQMFRDRPFFGHGYHHSFELQREKYMTAAEKLDPAFPTEPHSVYFDFLGSTGLVGFCTLVFFLAAAFRSYCDALRQKTDGVTRSLQISGFGTFAAFAIAAAFDSHFFHTQTLMMVLFFLALGQSAVVRSRAVGSAQFGSMPA